MCHDLLNDANFWKALTGLDQQIAEVIRVSGCPCGGTLHSACYPRKPRGVARDLLGAEYEYRLSFCCNQDGCRRRCTPPSVRFLGRRVYLGAVVTLACALTHGLTPNRRDSLIQRLRIDRRTLERWLTWWRQQLPMTPFWRALQGRFPSPLSDLPGALLGVMQGDNLTTRLTQCLALLMPLTTGSCTHCPRAMIDPQKMHL